MQLFELQKYCRGERAKRRSLKGKATRLKMEWDHRVLTTCGTFHCNDMNRQFKVFLLEILGHSSTRAIPLRPTNSHLENKVAIASVQGA
jgi:hypothetical protein